MKEHVSKRPSVTATKWKRIFHNDKVEVFESENYHDYYKVLINARGERPKYFFGETAWMDCQRYAVDNSDFSAYNIFK
jgi:hypothetical protein